MTADVAAVLRTLARLAPSGVRGTDSIVDLRASASRALWLGYQGDWRREDAGAMMFAAPSSSLRWGPIRRTAELDKLAALDALHREERALRLGWGVFCGAHDGQRRCTPMVSWPVRLQRQGRAVLLVEAGDPELTPLVDDRELADVLVEELRFRGGGLQFGDPTGSTEPWHLRAEATWLDSVADAAGIDAGSAIAPAVDPLTLDGTALVLGLVLYTARPVGLLTLPGALLGWAARPGIAATALGAVYGGPADPSEPPEPVPSPLPLTGAQREVVDSATTQRLTVVSGPPGCGKTHALVAVAMDSVARGGSVLLATRSREAADVIAGMLRRAAGPTPVLFGDTELRRTIAAELAEGLPAALPRRELGDRRDALEQQQAGAATARRAVTLALDDERAAARAREAADLMAVHRAVAPRLLDVTPPLPAAATALQNARRPRSGLLAGWRAERARRRVRAVVGAEPATSLDAISAAVAAVTDTADAARLQATGGTALAGVQAALLAAGTRVRAAAASWVDGVTADRSSRHRGSRRAVAELATALRSGRSTRRAMLARISGDDLVAALPLWVGTLGDVEDLLPPTPGLFDLVVIDEASHVDQPLAAPTLLRGGRAVVSGDPRQLRHVSFVGGDAVATATAAEGTGHLAGLLDVRAMSLFDLAAAAAPVRWLDEHHRCAPHLIGFAAERFYPGRMALLTTHPSIADRDCIDVHRVSGSRADGGVNAAEVTATLALLRERPAAGSIGVLSPFRAQADALERAVLAELTVEQIERAGIRVGTVHSFQGSECDELLISLALTAQDPPGSRRFVEDPNLFAVLTTRARRQIHVVTSLQGGTDGLVAAYLRHADEPPRETAGRDPADRWTAALATELRRAGATVRTGYPVGRWRVDLVVGDGEHAVAVETRPHPDGDDAHVDRWRTLAAAGWRCSDAYPTRFGHDPARAAVLLWPELTDGTAGRE